MDPITQILQWLGGHWWIIFFVPGIGYAWRYGVGGGRGRRRRRYDEAIARAQAPASPLAAAPPAAPPQAAQPFDARGQLKRLFDEHDEITARWLDYELDVAKMIAYPAMSDGRQPLTAAFLRAKKKADALRPSSIDARVTPEQVDEYREAVDDFSVAFDVAERDARRLRDSAFSADERKRLERAQHMLTVALDQSATAAERQSAYRRVREELNGLIGLSDAAVENLEKKVALQLEPGSEASGARIADPATREREVSGPSTGPGAETRHDDRSRAPRHDVPLTPPPAEDPDGLLPEPVRHATSTPPPAPRHLPEP